MTKPYRLTIIHPCIGRRPGEKYIRGWQMEPLPAALIAGLAPKDVEVRFYDDRMEPIPFDEPTDLVALSIETYTAKRCYQIASEYRKRRIPVVMGGFHATLVPEEVEEYADSIVIGESEGIFQEVIDDWRHGTPKKRYQLGYRPDLKDANPDRSIFQGKNYLPVGLIEAGRGCHFVCEFCAIQTVFEQRQTRRPMDKIFAEIEKMRSYRKLFFFVDDNITSNMDEAKAFFRELEKLKIRWVSQASINAAHDEEFLDIITRSGCMGFLTGFESIDEKNLLDMGKGFNMAEGGFEAAMRKIKRKRVRQYATFIFGYDEDTPETFDRTIAFAKRHGFYITAFNHLTPFPGTPLYKRLEKEGRLIYEKWWLDPNYSYNKIPFRTKHLTPDEIQHHCVRARREFYTVPSIARRGMNAVNRSDLYMWLNFWGTNALLRAEVSQRDFYPLGDTTWKGELLKVA